MRRNHLLVMASARQRKMTFLASNQPSMEIHVDNRNLTNSLFLVLTVALLSACGNSNNEPSGDAEPLFTGVNFIGVSVSNLDRSVDLYNSAADLQPLATTATLEGAFLDKFTGRASASAQTQLMRSVNAQLLFMEFADSSLADKPVEQMPVYGPGIAHVCYQVNEETQSYQHFLEGGATHIGDPNMVQLNPKNPVTYAYARDPDGMIIEIEHVDIDALNLPEPPENDYRIRHVSLATPDMDRLVDFYSILLGQHDPRRAGTFFKLKGDKLEGVSGLPGSKIEMAWFQFRNLELELIQYHSHPTERPTPARPLDALGYNMIVLDTTNIDEARERFIKAGGEIVSDVETALGGVVVFGRDPDGNLIGMQVVEQTHPLSSQNFTGNGT